MPDAITTLRKLGGVASIKQLRNAGVNEKLVRPLTKAERILRVRRGWYATLDANQLVVQAARVGGSLACISGAVALGAWQPPGSILHVSVPVGSRHLKDPTTGNDIVRSTTSVEIHWNGRAGALTSFRAGVLPILECLEEVVRCQPEDIAFAVVESAIHAKLVSVRDVRALAIKVPSRARLLRLAKGKSESGTESLFRFRMRNGRFTMEQQVEIPGVGRVDFLIGDRLIVEIDSEAHHGTLGQRRRDLKRDAVAATLGFETLRFDYDPVMFDWEFVATTVEAVVARRGHLGRQSRRYG